MLDMAAKWGRPHRPSMAPRRRLASRQYSRVAQASRADPGAASIGQLSDVEVVAARGTRPFPFPFPFPQAVDRRPAGWQRLLLIGPRRRRRVAGLRVLSWPIL
jgi:hypothetical protein